MMARGFWPELWLRYNAVQGVNGQRGTEIDGQYQNSRGPLQKAETAHNSGELAIYPGTASLKRTLPLCFAGN